MRSLSQSAFRCGVEKTSQADIAAFAGDRFARGQVISVHVGNAVPDGGHDANPAYEEKAQPRRRKVPRRS